jgi:hypothetical protein
MSNLPKMEWEVVSVIQIFEQSEETVARFDILGGHGKW